MNCAAAGTAAKELKLSVGCFWDLLHHHEHPPSFGFAALRLSGSSVVYLSRLRGFFLLRAWPILRADLEHIFWNAKTYIFPVFKTVGQIKGPIFRCHHVSRRQNAHFGLSVRPRDTRSIRQL